MATRDGQGKDAKPGSNIMEGEESAKGLVRCCTCTDTEKGNLRKCDNWRRIALLDVVGKVVARIILARLQKITDTELQCCFRKSRGCSDKVFTVRQIIEKHRSKSLVFINHKKVYDSIPRCRESNSRVYEGSKRL